MIGWRVDRGLWNELDRIQRGMDELFTALAGSHRPVLEAPWRHARLFPLINLKEVDNSFVVTAEIPGMKQNDISVSVSDNILTIKGEKKQEKEVKEENFHRVERIRACTQRGWWPRSGRKKLCPSGRFVKG